MEKPMSELKRSECISLPRAEKQLGIVRTTLNVYINALGIAKHKFPLDTKVYITNTDYERIKQFVTEREESEEMQ
jgi:hypothetical protein